MKKKTLVLLGIGIVAYLMLKPKATLGSVELGRGVWERIKGILRIPPPPPQPRIPLIPPIEPIEPMPLKPLPPGWQRRRGYIVKTLLTPRRRQWR